MNAKIKKRNDPAVARKFVTIGVMVSTVMVFVSVFVAVFFNPEAVAKRTMDKLAREYYENYYYEKFIESLDRDALESRMKSYETTGFQPVLLRQLLLYQNGKNSEYKKYFENKNYFCDKNETSAKFYPVAPYGVKDYRVEYNYTCAEE